MELYFESEDLDGIQEKIKSIVVNSFTLFVNNHGAEGDAFL
jgi:hypothetical protein